MDPRLEWGCCPKAAWRPLSSRARREPEWKATLRGPSRSPALPSPGPWIWTRRPRGKNPEAVASEDMEAQQKRPRAICRAPEAEEDHPGAHPGDLGLTWRVLFGKVFSQTTVCRFEALLLSLKNTGKQRPPLQKGVQEADDENLQETCEAETLVQAQKRKRTGMEGQVGGNLESMFLQRPKPTLCSRSATWPNGSGLRKMCSKCASATVARKANNRAVTIHERIWTLLGLLSQGNQYPFFWRQGPILVPQAMRALTSLHCTPRSFP